MYYGSRRASGRDFVIGLSVGAAIVIVMFSVAYFGHELAALIIS